jgi:hypothetical protein
MNNLKPIETKWKGYRFRSRLEARWAVFFNRVRLSWEYEPEGFVLPSGGRYLPDFRIRTPQGNTIWYEVKPTNGDEEKFKEFSEVASSNTVCCQLLRGDPVEYLRLESERDHGIICPHCGHIGDTAPSCDIDEHNKEFYYECTPCDVVWRFDHLPQDAGVFNIPCRFHKGWVVAPTDIYLRLETHVIQAAYYARSVRFEHGETPS